MFELQFVDNKTAWDAFKLVKRESSKGFGKKFQQEHQQLCEKWPELLSGPDVIWVDWPLLPKGHHLPKQRNRVEQHKPMTEAKKQLHYLRDECVYIDSQLAESEKEIALHQSRYSKAQLDMNACSAKIKELQESIKAKEAEVEATEREWNLANERRCTLETKRAIVADAIRDIVAK
eukprot:TRINITY_DN3971_c0_g1_i12.p3 TRINITY_DN3971_c0_g1~~TRINITY_DN3971_c0_g1_i12.p3  ORF type:complete len:176 (-),score=50.07 TRINITY_DN3971_c0_g1_i12:785-1312(-)